MTANTMKIRIPVLVGSNGRWAANGYPVRDGGVDWAFMEEIVLDPFGATEKDINANTLRMFVDVEVPMPEMPVIKGAASAATGGRND